MRRVEKVDFEGKTIASIDNSCVNVVVFTFTDGKSISLYSEVLVTPAGCLGELVIDD